jgi:hypothetical protein
MCEPSSSPLLVISSSIMLHATAADGSFAKTHRLTASSGDRMCPVRVSNLRNQTRPDAVLLVGEFFHFFRKTLI